MNEIFKLKELLDNNGYKSQLNELNNGFELKLCDDSNDVVGTVLCTEDSVGGKDGFLEVHGLNLNSPLFWRVASDTFVDFQHWLKVQDLG